PLAETGVLAGWVLAECGLEIGDGALSVAPGRPEDDLRVEGDRVSGSVHRVPWGRSVERVVAIVADRVVVVAPAQARQIDAVTNVAGEPRDTLHFDGV